MAEHESLGGPGMMTPVISFTPAHNIYGGAIDMMSAA